MGITDIMPTVGQLYCNGKLGDTHLSAVQLTILIGMGLQLLGLFNKTVRKLSQYLNSVVEKEVGAQLDSASAKKAINFSKPLTEDLMDELDEEAQKLKLQEDKRSKLKEEQKKWQEDDLAQFAIKGDEQEWTKSLAKNPKGVVSVKISSFSDCSVEKNED